jgi:hypothetical protein
VRRSHHGADAADARQDLHDAHLHGAVVPPRGRQVPRRRRPFPAHGEPPRGTQIFNPTSTCA